MRGLSALVLAVGLGAGGWWLWLRDESALPPQLAEAPATDAAPTVPADADEDIALLDAFLDIPGDPMRLNFGTADRSAARRQPRPEGLEADRGSGELVVLRDVMVSTEDRVVTALPSSREDFAIFQAQRRGLSAGAPSPDAADATAEVLVALTPADADTIASARQQPHPRTATEAAVWLHAQGQRRGHARLVTTPTPARTPLVDDLVLRVTSSRPLVDILTQAGLGQAEAEAAATRAAAMGLPEPAPGQIIALRLLTDPAPAAQGGGRLAQLAVYSGSEYLGALARDDTAEPGAIPIGPNSAPDSASPDSASPDDASPDNATAAAPADAPADATEETPMAEDSASGAPVPVLVEAADPWLGSNLQRLAAAAATEAAPAPSEFRVLDAFYSAAMRNRLPAGLVGEVIMLLSEAHDLDASARPGDRMTLVYSAEPPADPEAPSLGQVLFVGIEGAEVEIRCYLYRPSPTQPLSCYGASRGSGPGAGTVGTTVLPDGPEGGLTASAAVETLIDRIIIIESAGRADARNPLSTATGLGQFIESTWIRMMRTYRPDLYTSLPRAELLALRTDPVISREMVTALAREGESYLRARGHQITPGRLYLAHFLGMEGAHLVLTQPPEAGLLEVLGAGVIRANPFLEGRDVAYIVDWAEGRMRGGGRAVVVRDPPGLVALRAMVDAALTEG